MMILGSWARMLFTDTDLQDKTMRQLLLSWPSEFSPSCVASVFQVLLRFIRLAGNYVPQFRGRQATRASLLAVLGCKFRVLWCFGLGNADMLRRPKPPDLSKASPYSVSGTSAVLRGHVVAASITPGSAIYPNSQERAEWQTVTTAPALTISPPTPTNDGHSVDQAHTPNPPPPSDGRIIAHLDSRDLSIVNTRSSNDSFSVVRASRVSIHDEPSRLSTATHFQFGHLPDPSQSSDRLYRPPSLTNPPPSTLYQLYRPESTDLPSLVHPQAAHGDSSISPIIRPSTSSYTHEPLGAQPMTGDRRKRSSTSVVLNVQNLSTQSDPVSSSTRTYPPQVTTEPFDTDTATACSSPASATVDLHGEAPIQPLNNFLPEGRFVQLINSDQVPRYTKNITM